MRQVINIPPQPALNDAKYYQGNFRFADIWFRSVGLGWTVDDLCKNKTLQQCQSVLFALTIFVYRFGGLGYSNIIIGAR